MKYIVGTLFAYTGHMDMLQATLKIIDEQPALLHRNYLAPRSPEWRPPRSSTSPSCSYLASADLRVWDYSTMPERPDVVSPDVRRPV